MGASTHGYTTGVIGTRGKGITLAAAILAAAVVAPAARAATTNSATLFDDTRSTSHRFAPFTAHAGNATYAIEGDARAVRVWVRDAGGDDWSFGFAAPPPELLEPGVYDRATTMTYERGRPGMRASRPASGCATIDGRFEIKEFALGPDGVPDRLWAVFELLCDNFRPEHGEVRFNAQGPAGPITPVPAVQRWAAQDFGVPHIPAAVTLRATAAASVGQLSIAGSQAADFSLESDGCSGRTLAAGATCQVRVGFQPRAVGARTAVLSSGNGVRVPLQGFSYGGRTRLELHSEPGDPVGGGRDLTFTPANAWIRGYAVGSRAGFFVSDNEVLDGWIGSFRAAMDAPLVPGRYTGARATTHLQMPQPEPGLRIDENSPCTEGAGEFTVTDIAHHPDGGVQSYEASFVQRCSPADSGVLRGVFSYRVGDTTPPAPWMAGGPAAVDDVAGGVPQGGAPGGVAWRCGAGSARRQARIGTRRADRLRGSGRSDRILARRGNDRVDAGRGDDCVVGGPGRDRLRGGPGADLVRGGAGRDVVIGGRGRDRVDCGPGRDVAHVGPGDRTRGCERIVRG